MRESQACMSGVVDQEKKDASIKAITALEFHPDGQALIVATVDGLMVVDQCRVTPPPTVASYMRLSPKQEKEKARRQARLEKAKGKR